VAIAEDGRRGEIRFIGEIGPDPTPVRRLVGRLEKRHTRLHFCYEAGPTGYGPYRQLTEMGHQCTVVAPSMIPRRPGDRIKANRRDAMQLARLLRAGELTEVWVPDEAHEAIFAAPMWRDLECLPKQRMLPIGNRRLTQTVCRMSCVCRVFKGDA
jgi:hypothetical protein